MEFDELVEQDINQLYFEVGKNIDTLPTDFIREFYTRGKEELMEFKSFPAIAKRGKLLMDNFIEKSIKRLREVICPKYDKNKGNLNDATAIATAISAIWGIPTSFGTLFLAIVVRRGLDSFCSI